MPRQGHLELSRTTHTRDVRDYTSDIQTARDVRLAQLDIYRTAGMSRTAVGNFKYT